MSNCKHEFTMIDLRGHWHCAKCGIVEIVYLRARAEAAEKELAKLKAENERLKEDLKASYSHIGDVDSKMGDLYYERDMAQQENERLKAENSMLRTKNTILTVCS